MTTYHLKEDIKKLASLAAGITDAFTSAILLPTGFLSGPVSSPLSGSGASARLDGSQSDTTKVRRESLELLGVCSMSSCIARDCRIPVGAGLLGWVAENGRSLHLAPFETDSGPVGIYSGNESIRSLAAVPIPLPIETPGGSDLFGVLMCDSRTSASFSRTHIKHLEELALLTSRLIFWGLMRRDSASGESAWRSFTHRAAQLSDAIGIDSVEVLRISIENFPQLEARLGTTRAIEAAEQFARLIQQALPPHFPVTRIPSGEILVALDNMMSSFFQQKFRSLATRPDRSDRSIVIAIQNFSSKGLRMREFDLDTVLKQGTVGTNTESPITTTKTVAGAGGTRA